MNKIVEHWDTKHRNNDIKYLSGTNPKTVFKILKTNKYIVPDANVLVIGVGMGYDITELVDKKCNVYALDISKIALDRVKCYTIDGFLSSEIERLPDNTFDLVMSYLVSIHMTDDDLIRQISCVVKSLKAKGVFAMQVTNLDQLDTEKFNKLSWQMEGCFTRSIEAMKIIVKIAGGKIKFISKLIPEPTHQFNHEENKFWYTIHITK